jgi:hypothetical protein
MIDASGLVVYWQFMGRNAITRDEKLVTRFHERPPTHCSVANWLRRLPSGEESRLGSGIHRFKPSDDLIDFKIHTELTAFLFPSVRTLTNALKIPPSTIRDHLRKGHLLLKTDDGFPRRLIMRLR